MSIYVQSCGKSQEHDYCWLEIGKGNPTSIIPPGLKEIRPEELIDSQKPSMILARSGNYLMLLITALKTRDGRTDFMGRQIRNSVAWIEKDDGSKEQLLRKIAIQALDEKLADAVDAAITNDADSEYGFTADFDKLKKIEGLANSREVSSQEANPNLLKFGDSNNERLKFDLISDLTKYALPKPLSDIQIWVLVTTMKSLDGLKAKGIWRGLSSRIKSEDWEEIDVSFLKTSTSQNVQKKTTRPKIAAAVLVASMMVMIIMWLISHHPLPQHLQPDGIIPVESSQMKTSSGLYFKTLQ